MRFLIKSAFWLGLALFIIPMPKGEKPSAERTVSAIEAVGAAQEAFSDIKGFCDRKPGACEVGQAALVTVGERAKVGAKMVYDYLDTQLPSDKAAPQSTGTVPNRAAAPPEPPANLAPATAQPMHIQVPAPNPMKLPQPRPDPKSESRAKEREVPRG